MTKDELKTRALEIIDNEVSAPCDLISFRDACRAEQAVSGCLIERLLNKHSLNEDDYTLIGAIIDGYASKVWGPSDDYSFGKITKAQLRETIASL